MKVVCVGHSTFDTTLPMKEYPIENIKYRLENHIECGGGPASNGAYLLAKWGMDTTICSVIGDDYYADQVIADFQKIGANTEYLEKMPNLKIFVFKGICEIDESTYIKMIEKLLKLLF